MTIESKKLEFKCTSDEFRIAVRGQGVKVEIDHDGNVTVYSDRPARLPPAEVAEDASTEALKVGAQVSDGSVYVGVSPATGKPMYTTRWDEDLTLTFHEAAKHAKGMDAHGHRDWRVPSKAELNALFQNRAAIRGFNETGHFERGWYWSASRNIILAWGQSFDDGIQHRDFRNRVAALRCVRG